MLARRFVQRLVPAAQGSLMLRHAPQPVAEAFLVSRIDPAHGRVYGTLPEAVLAERIIERAWPE